MNGPDRAAYACIAQSAKGIELGVDPSAGGGIGEVARRNAEEFGDCGEFSVAGGSPTVRAEPFQGARAHGNGATGGDGCGGRRG